MPNPENKPIVAIDMDDVLFPMVDSLIQYVEKEHKVRMTHAEFVNYDIRDIWKGGPVEAEAIFAAYKDQASPAIAPLKGAQEAINKLSRNYEIILMTARDVAVEEKTKEWLYHHFPEMFKQVHLVGNKRESLTFRPKAEVCLELGVSYLIDDGLRHILEAHLSGIKAILFGDYPWNQADKLPAGVMRVKNWQEVLEYFDGEAK